MDASWSGHELGGVYRAGRTPEAVDDASAGVVGHASQTAWQCVESVGPGKGDLVLVHGATVGVGGYAVQLLVARGARVVATAIDARGADLVRGLVAADVVDGATPRAGEGHT
jgi:NADPH:quinone reductase-like Zn-dependent oxidoreductase